MTLCCSARNNTNLTLMGCICISLLMCINVSVANTLISSNVNQQLQQSIAPNTAVQQNMLEPSSSIHMSNINQIDNDASDLNQLNRTLQLEKARLEIKKLRNGGSINTSGNAVSNHDIHAQTTVLGVAINQSGRKIAWLQFADGGTLTVSIGSQVGKYMVADISMTRVTLMHEVGHGLRRRIQYVYLKRAYPGNDLAQSNMAHHHHGLMFAPSPVITDANTGDRNYMVPPLVRTLN